MKKIWVCGALGMLGSHFPPLLKERNIPFVATTSRQIDLTNLDSVSDYVRIQKITHIINCAAYTQVDKAESEQKRAYQVNAMGPHHLGVAARRHGARVLHFSTDYVFDGKSRSPYTEEHFCSPIGAYGMSKFAGEVKLFEEHEHSCVIRTSWLFGYSGKNFVETMIRLMNEKETLRIVADQVGRPTYCLDLARAALELTDEEGIFHFANSFETSWYQFAKEIHRQGEELGFPMKVKFIEPISTAEYPTPCQRPAYSTLSTKKIEQALNSVPRPWQEALTEYLHVLKQHQHTLQPA